MSRKIRVLKFGGSSLKDREARRCTVGHIAAARRAGDRIVAVVSAPGDMTDELIAQAKTIHPDPDERSLAQLLSIGEQQSCALVAMELNAQGMPAVPMTGWQAGIRTDGKDFVGARIAGIDTTPICAHLDAGQIVVVAGFQGLFVQDGKRIEVAVLERGGSDTTAIHLACALDADECVLYKDVDGIAAAPPSIVPGAYILNALSLDELSEAARGGAEIVSDAALRMLHTARLTLSVRPMFSDAAGTSVVPALRHERPVSTITFRPDAALITVEWMRGYSDTPLFKALAQAKINVDLVEGCRLTIRQSDVGKAEALLAREGAALGIRKFNVQTGFAQITVVGEGMRNTPGVLEQIQEVLEENAIWWFLRGTSEIAVSYVVRNGDYRRGIEALHRHFFREAAPPARKSSFLQRCREALRWLLAR